MQEAAGRRRRLAAVLGVLGEEIERGSAMSARASSIANWNSDDQIVIPGEVRGREALPHPPRACRPAGERAFIRA
jgi:malonyl CoA-acyl carrier protein transacylase